MEWNGIVCKIRKLNGLEQYGMEWDGWDGFPKHGLANKNLELPKKPSTPKSWVKRRRTNMSS